MNKNKLKVVSLFSGYGTQELALKYIGVDYENVANCDNFKQANECYDVLHTTTYGNLGDITKIDEKMLTNFREKTKFKVVVPTHLLFVFSNKPLQAIYAFMQLIKRLSICCL